MTAILFVKTSSLGDVVHNCPAVSDAARALPGVHIDWVVEEAFAGVAALHAAVRRVIPVAVRRWRNRFWHPAAWSELAAFRRELARERYDAVIDTQSLVKSALVASAAHGVRHGLDGASAREPLAARFYDAVHPVPRALHAVERNQRLVAAALRLPPAARIDYGLRVPRVEKTVSVVLLTMTSRADKLWPEERWIELARALAMPVILPWGSASERARAGRIAAASGRAEVPPRLEIDALARLFAGARSVIGLDTGLTHFAAALGTPTIGIYCGSDPALTGLYGMSWAKNVGAAGRPPEVRDVLRSLA